MIMVTKRRRGLARHVRTNYGGVGASRMNFPVVSSAQDLPDFLRERALAASHERQKNAHCPHRRAAARIASKRIAFRSRKEGQGRGRRNAVR